MVTSDMQRAADLPSRCCLFNNCVQFTTFYMQRFTTILRKMQTSIFLLLVIVMDSMKRNVTGFSIRAGSRRNSPATPHVFAAYFD